MKLGNISNPLSHQKVSFQKEGPNKTQTTPNPHKNLFMALGAVAGTFFAYLAYQKYYGLSPIVPEGTKISTSFFAEASEIHRTNIVFNEIFDSTICGDHSPLNFLKDLHCSQAFSSLYKITQMPNEQQLQLLSPLFPKDASSEVKTELLGKLAQVDSTLLKAVHLDELNTEKKLLDLILLSNEEFSQLPLQSLKNYALKDSNIVKIRLGNVLIESVKPEDLKNISQLPLSKLHNLSGKDIQDSIENFPDEAFLYLEDTQLEGLDLESLSGTKFTHIFLSNPKQRIGDLTPEQAFSCLPKFSSWQVRNYITDAQFKAFDLARLSRDKLDDLLSNNPRGRIGNLKPEVAFAILDKLDSWNVRNFITDAQFNAFDLTKLSRGKLDDLLSNNPRSRVGNLKPEMAFAMLDKLDSWNVRNFITDDQFNSFDLTKLPNDKLLSDLLSRNPRGRIGNLKPEVAFAMLDKLERWDVRNYITDTQFNSFDLTKLPTDKLQDLLSNNARNRIGNLKPEVVLAILDKLDSWSIQNFITDTQFKSFDLTKLPNDKLKDLLSNNPRGRIGNLKPEVALAILDKLDSWSVQNYITDDQFKSFDLVKLPAAKLKDLLSNNPRGRIGNLKPEVAISILDKLDSWSIRNYITDDQYEKIDLRLVSEQIMDDLLSQNPESRIALISDEVYLNALISKLNSKVIYLNNQQISKLQTELLSQRQVDLLFQWSEKNLRKEFTFRGKLLVDEEHFQKIAKKTEEISLKHLQVLSKPQIDAIRSKLSKETLEIIKNLETYGAPAA